jgi:hypothetical protein
MNRSLNKFFRSAEQIRLIEQTIFGNINVVQQQEMPDNINLNNILKKIQIVIPDHFVQNLDGIYVGEYDFLLKRDLNALYKDGVIYVLPDQDDEQDVYEDIVHEIAHCVEETYGMDIYEDGKIEQEFLRKRRALLDTLKAYGYNEVSDAAYGNTEFSRKFDEFLYLIVGYPTLTQLTPNLFVSPYGATSLREYFANCFEEYFARRQYDHVKKISPAVYEKIELLLGII